MEQLTPSFFWSTPLVLGFVSEALKISEHDFKVSYNIIRNHIMFCELYKGAFKIDDPHRSCCFQGRRVAGSDELLLPRYETVKSFSLIFEVI